MKCATRLDCCTWIFHCGGLAILLETELPLMVAKPNCAHIGWPLTVVTLILALFLSFLVFCHEIACLLCRVSLCLYLVVTFYVRRLLLSCFFSLELTSFAKPSNLTAIQEGRRAESGT